MMPQCTSISTNIIHGGTAINITAGSCEFIWEVRPIPGGSADRATSRKRTDRMSSYRSTNCVAAMHS